MDGNNKRMELNHNIIRIRTGNETRWQTEGGLGAGSGLRRGQGGIHGPGSTTAHSINLHRHQGANLICLHNSHARISKCLKPWMCVFIYIYIYNVNLGIKLAKTTWCSPLLSSVSLMVLICSFPRIYRCPSSCVMIEQCHWLTASDLPQHHLQNGLLLGNSSSLYFLFGDVLNTMETFLGFYSIWVF